MSSVFSELGISGSASNAACFDGVDFFASGVESACVNPATGRAVASVRNGTESDYERCVESAVRARRAWRETPAPARGEVVRRIGDALRARKAALGALISLEMGKVLSEGEGEVQEFIDVCDFAAGLARALAGQLLPSERAGHVLLEAWNPLGTVAIITAFNFPCAVLGWNLAISLICGNTHVWKGASSTSLVTLATARVIAQVLRDAGAPPGVFTVVSGPGRTVGERLINDARCALVSFTGSSGEGRGKGAGGRAARARGAARGNVRCGASLAPWRRRGETRASRFTLSPHFPSSSSSPVA
jgi:aldehyde dehydrogenase family 7 protein A1